jgi:flavin-binding protein dodecin
MHFACCDGLRTLVPQNSPIAAQGDASVLRSPRPPGKSTMSIAKVIEITAESNVSFEAAINEGIAKAAKTVSNIKSAWIKEQKVIVENDHIVG